MKVRGNERELKSLNAECAECAEEDCDHPWAVPDYPGV